jgi:methionyl-tRNA synthetase
MENTNVSYDEFAKLDLRVAKILEVEDIAGADKLYKLTIDLGELGKRTICAGIKQHYKKEDLIGKEIVVVANLEPRKMKGVESQGMLLAASTENHEKIIFLKPEKAIEPGSKVQ